MALVGQCEYVLSSDIRDLKMSIEIKEVDRDLIWGWNFFFKDFIYLFMRDTEREKGRDIGRGRSRHPTGSPMWDSIPDHGIMPWAKGRHSTTEPPRHPFNYIFFYPVYCSLIGLWDRIWGLKRYSDTHRIFRKCLCWYFD